MGKKLKYMGVSHAHTLDKGDDFGGRLAEPLSQTVSFDRSNNWVVNTDEVGLSEDAVAIILTDRDFKDVSDMPRIPLNKHQTTFLGMRDGDAEPDPNATGEEDEELQYAAAAEVDPEEQAKREAVAAEAAKVDAEAAAAAAAEKVSAARPKK